MELKPYQAILLPAGKKWKVSYMHGELFQETEAIGRVNAKKFLALLKEQGFQTFNEKKGGKVVEV